MKTEEINAAFDAWSDGLQMTDKRSWEAGVAWGRAESEATLRKELDEANSKLRFYSDRAEIEPDDALTPQQIFDYTSPEKRSSPGITWVRTSHFIAAIGQCDSLRAENAKLREVPLNVLGCQVGPDFDYCLAKSICNEALNRKDDDAKVVIPNTNPLNRSGDVPSESAAKPCPSCGCTDFYIRAGVKACNQCDDYLSSPVKATVAELHNPDNLTPEQVGVADGWRLLDEDEGEPWSVNSKFPLGVEYFGKFGKPGWLSTGTWFRVKSDSFRTRLTRAELCIARKQEPEPTREKAEARPIANVAGDWPEDAPHENGNYHCRCCQCGRMFVGHKRRVVCKICATAATTETPAASDAGVGATPETDATERDMICQSTHGRYAVVLSHFARKLERERDTTNSTLRDREAQWRFGVSVLDFCILKAAQMRDGELPMDAIRRWMQERWDFKQERDTARQQITAMQEQIDALRQMRDEAFEEMNKAVAEKDAAERDSEAYRKDMDDIKQEMNASLLRSTPLREAILLPANCGVHGHFRFQENGGRCMMCQREELQLLTERQLRERAERERDAIREFISKSSEEVENQQRSELTSLRTQLEQSQAACAALREALLGWSSWIGQSFLDRLHAAEEDSRRLDFVDDPTKVYWWEIRIQPHAYSISKEGVVNIRAAIDAARAKEAE